MTRPDPSTLPPSPVYTAATTWPDRFQQGVGPSTGARMLVNAKLPLRRRIRSVALDRAGTELMREDV